MVLPCAVFRADASRPSLGTRRGRACVARGKALGRRAATIRIGEKSAEHGHHARVRQNGILAGRLNLNILNGNFAPFCDAAAVCEHIGNWFGLTHV